MNSNESIYFGNNRITRICVIQIGCGGTGSYLVPPLTKFLASIKQHNVIVNYFLVDDDIVEEKNTKRQNFVPCMIDQYKAIALSELYNMDDIITPITYKLTGSSCNINTYRQIKSIINQYIEDNIYDEASYDKRINIVIGCVDSIESRKAIHEFIYNYLYMQDDLYYVDSGNFITSGQSYVYCYKMSDFDKSYTKNYDHFIENFVNNRDAVKMDSAPSCSNNGDQSIFANFRAADILYSIISEILTRGETTVTNIKFLRYSLDSTMNTLEQLKHNML